MTSSSGLSFGRRHVRLLVQSEVAECGLACIAMIADYHGLELDLGILRRRFTPASRGATLASVMSCAEQIGMISRPLRIELEDLTALQLPAILHWNMNHFVVLEKVNDNKAYILDPSGTARWIDFEDVSPRFTGVALELSPSLDFQPEQHRHRLRLTQLWSATQGLGKALGQILVLSALAQALLLLLPYFSQVAIDRAVQQTNASILAGLGIGFLMIGIVHGLIFWFRSEVILTSGASLSYGLSVNLARRMFRLPISWFNSRHVGDVMARFQSIQPIRDMLTQDAVAATLDGVFSIVTLLLMFYYSPVAALVPLAGFIAMLCLRAAMFSKQRKIEEGSIVYTAKEQSDLIQILQGMRSLRLSGRQRNKELIWRSRLVEAINAQTNQKKIENILSSTQTLITNTENIAFLWVAFWLTINGSLSLGAVFALYAYKVQFTNSAASFAEKLWEFRMLGLHVDRIADIALQEEDARFTQQPRPARSVAGKVELRNISFRYSEFEAPVLTDISLTLHPNECIAITGPSGGGKSTLAQLMLGLLKPDAGEILVDNVPLETFGYSNYFSSVAAVLQDDTLFAGSILDNISLFDGNIDREEVSRVASLADVAADIEAMPMGYDTLVGDMGAALSGGQQQRILLARALYQQPKILILDEGTSHLDKQSELNVTRAISGMDVSRVLIAHRQETIATADRVLVLEDGVLTDT